MAAAFSRSTVAFGALGGAKFDAEARVRTPDDVAGLFELVVADHEGEIVRNADLAAHLKTGTHRGHIAHPAIDTAGPVEADTAGLERAPAFVVFLPLLPPSSVGVRAARAASPWPSTSDGNGQLHARPASLSGSEKDHQKTAKTFRNR